MSTPLSLFAVVLIVLIALYVLRARAVSREERLCRLFELDPSEYELLGSDLGGGRDKVFLKGDGALGVPDAVFRHRPTRDIVVGEAKQRSFRGRVSAYEENQVVLYMGLAEHRFRSSVSAVIHYGCGKCVPLQPNPEHYRRLIGLIPEYRKLAKRLGLWRAKPRRRATRSLF